MSKKVWVPKIVAQKNVGTKNSIRSKKKYGKKEIR